MEPQAALRRWDESQLSLGARAAGGARLQMVRRELIRVRGREGSAPYEWNVGPRGPGRSQGHSWGTGEVRGQEFRPCKGNRPQAPRETDVGDGKQADAGGLPALLVRGAAAGLAEWWVGQAGWLRPGVSTRRGWHWVWRDLVSPCPAAGPGLSRPLPHFQWVPL